MLSETVEREASASKQSHQRQNNDSQPRGLVLVKASAERDFSIIIPHAIAIAQGLQRLVRLVEIVDSGVPAGIPVDPVEWELKRRQAEAHLAALKSRYGESGCAIDVRVLQSNLPVLAGDCHDPQSEPIFCFVRRDTELPWDHDEATRRFMQMQCSSILLVPAESTVKLATHYRRILVALDGSSRAERVLPVAAALARHHHAELLVTHAIPSPEMILSGPLEAEAVELRRRLFTRNRQVAMSYLKGIHTRYEADVEKLSVKLLGDGDVRQQLIEVAAREHVDLMIIASHGVTGHPGVSTGSVARFVLEHVSMPVLMIGRERELDESPLSVGADTRGPRAPGLSV